MILRKKDEQKKANTRSLPSGIMVETASGEYLIQGATRLRLASPAARDSWSFPYRIKTDEEYLKSYPVVGKLGFRGGTVFWSLEDGLYYLVEKNLKRQIVNAEWFEWLGIDRLNVPVASLGEAKLHKTGEVLN